MCSTSSGDLLVIMSSDDDEQTKVVRYSGTKQEQNIQWDGEGVPLYSSSGEFYSTSQYTYQCHYKYLCENKNLDICVADWLAGAVVVVSADGKLCFRYTDPPSITRRPFKPHGITTDSKANILIADCWNHTSWTRMANSSATSTTVGFGVHGIYQWIRQITSLWLSGSHLKLRNYNTSSKNSLYCSHCAIRTKKHLCFYSK